MAHDSISGTPTSSSPQPGITNQDDHFRRRRGSSFVGWIDSIRESNAPNSISNFINSVQRASAFETTPVHRGSVIVTTADEDGDGNQAISSSAPRFKSLLSEQMRGARALSHASSTGPAVQSSSHFAGPTETSTLLRTPSNMPSVFSHSTMGWEPPLGMSYGSVSSSISHAARQRAYVLIQEKADARQRVREALEDESDDMTDTLSRITSSAVEEAEPIVGESTVPMTIFNSINVMIGVGILALPLAFAYCGWVLGIVLITAVSIVTLYTALLLAKCIDTNSAASTYGDIAFLAFGAWGREMVNFVFVLELTAANVAQVLLFGDSMHLLVPSFSGVGWKLLIAIGMIPFNFVPLKYLSITSILGILSMMTIITLIFADGWIKPSAPGSLRQPAQTYTFPENPLTIFLGISLFMAPLGGHSVFPSIYKDMRHPRKYPKAVRTTFTFTTGLNLSMILIGYLMFGEAVHGEITSDILSSKAYPQALSVILLTMVAIVPITKIPLANRPIMNTINKTFLIDLRQMDAKARAQSLKSVPHQLGRVSIAVLVNVVQLGIALIFPEFDSVMALMGSCLCFTICVILPVSFYLSIFWGTDEIKFVERVVCYVIVVISTILGVVGTVFAVLPKDKIGA